MLDRIMQPILDWLFRRPMWLLAGLGALPLVALSFSPMYTRLHYGYVFIGIVGGLWLVVFSMVALVKDMVSWRNSYILHATDSMYKLKMLRWRDFEGLVAEIFRLKGYHVKQLGGDGPDGGIDLLMTNKQKERVAVQCKLNRYDYVDVKVVRELYGVIKSRGIPHAYVVTTTDFTEDAVLFAKEKEGEIALINGERLYGMIRDHRQTSSEPEDSIIGRLLTRAQSLKCPPCPNCGTDMKLCKTKRGRRFWGCVNWPVCKGKRALTKYDYEVLRRSGD